MTAVRCHHQVGTGSREGGKVGTGREIKRKKEEQRETLGEGKSGADRGVGGQEGEAEARGRPRGAQCRAADAAAGTGRPWQSGVCPPSQRRGPGAVGVRPQAGGCRASGGSWQGWPQRAGAVLRVTWDRALGLPAKSCPSASLCEGLLGASRLQKMRKPSSQSTLLGRQRVDTQKNTGEHAAPHKVG